MTVSPPEHHELRYVGRSVTRREGAHKLTGRSRYIDDMHVEGALTGRTIRTTIAAGRVRDIRFPEGFPWNEFTIVTAKDLPVNEVALITNEQPALVDSIVRHHQEAILLIAHEDPGLVQEAARAIEIVYEKDPGIFEMEQGRVLKDLAIRHGNTEQAFSGENIVFEGEYATGAQEHVYIEPNGFIAWWENETVVLHGSNQCPYYVHKAVKNAFALERDDQVRVVQETTGGGFGGKEEFPSMVAIHTALLSRKAGGKPVRLIYDRAEDMACSTKRHPSITRIRTACTREGVFKGIEVTFHIDGGAYLTLSPVVLSRGLLHSGGPYRWPAAKMDGLCWFTNSPPYGAFRGFGAPQSEFAIERHLDRLSQLLGICPIELRRKNFLQRGDVLPTSQIVEEDPELDHIVDRALELSDYRAKQQSSPCGSGHGMGLSVFYHGTGFTGSGEVYLSSVVALEAQSDGTVEIQVSSTEIGQGTETVFAQIAAEGLGINIEQIRFRKPETGAVPDSGPTVASRTCSIVGGLVEKAARQMREKLNGRDVAEAAAMDSLRAEARYEPPPGLVWNEETYQGCAYGAYSWGCNVAEIVLDSVTAELRVEKMWGIYDIGCVINPVLAVGQVEGGMAQGAGWATCEDVVLREGLMQNTRVTNYIIPTSADGPDMVVEFVEHHNPIGAFGSKGVGELPMDGPPAAIANAVAHATGQNIVSIPIRPEDILK